MFTLYYVDYLLSTHFYNYYYVIFDRICIIQLFDC